MSKFTSLFTKSIYNSTQLLPGKKHSKIQVGDFLRLKRTFTAEQVQIYANISGDNNPIHTDEEAGKKSIFKQRITHGMLSGSIFSQMLGATLHDAIYLSQTLKFTAPVFLNEEVEGRMEIIEVNNKKKMIKLKTSLHKIHDNDKVAIDGEALVLYKYLED